VSRGSKGIEGNAVEKGDILRPRVVIAAGFRGGPAECVGGSSVQGVMSDRLATRANKEKQRKTRGYEGNRNTHPSS